MDSYDNAAYEIEDLLKQVARAEANLKTAFRRGQESMRQRAVNEVAAPRSLGKVAAAIASLPIRDDMDSA